MRCHDWTLGYSVSDYGATVTLDLIRTDLEPTPTRLKTVFREVWIYHFVHTQGTIILDIIETPVGDMLEQYKTQIIEWNRLHGLNYWSGSISRYATDMKKAGCVGWMIYSSLGFE